MSIYVQVKDGPGYPGHPGIRWAPLSELVPGGGGGGSGTVTSVALAAPAFLSVSGSPVTGAGTLTLALATQSANVVFAGPTTGAAAAPTFRALVAADVPDLSASYVPVTRTVAGHALSSDVTVSASDVGLGNVTNDAQTKAAVVPNTAPAAGKILAGNAGGTAYAPVALSGDATLASTGALTLAASGASAATYGDATHVPQVTVDVKGRITAVSNVAISGGGGGATVFTSAYASPPGSPATGDLWLPSDGVSLYRWSGSAWVPWGPVYPFTDPTLAGLSTWVNQGSAVVDATKGGISLYRDGTDGVSVHARVKAAPSTPYTITAAFTAVQLGTFTEAGLCFRDSAGGAINGFSLLCGTNSWYVRQYASATSLSSNAGSGTAQIQGPVIWMRLIDDGTNRKYQFSPDGQFWLTALSEGRTTFLTANQVGIYVSAYAGPSALNLLHWKET